MEIAEKVLRVLKDSNSVSKENLDLIYDFVIDQGIASFKEEVPIYYDLIDYFIRSSFNVTRKRHDEVCDEITYDVNFTPLINKIKYNEYKKVVAFSGPGQRDIVVHLEDEYFLVYPLIKRIFVFNRNEIDCPDYVTRDFSPKMILASENARNRIYVYLNNSKNGIMQRNSRFFNIYIGDRSEVIINGID